MSMQNSQAFDFEDRLVFRVNGMKMRRCVIAEIHSDNDTVEP